MVLDLYKPSKLVFFGHFSVTSITQLWRHNTELYCKQRKFNGKRKFRCPQRLTYLASNHIKLGISAFTPSTVIFQKRLKIEQLVWQKMGTEQRQSNKYKQWGKIFLIFEFSILNVFRKRTQFLLKVLIAWNMTIRFF